MKKLSILILCSTFLLGCHQEETNAEYPLQAYETWVPGNHYFRASLMSLHFMTETMPVSKLDSIYKGLQRNYEIPVSPKNLPDGVYKAASPYDAFDYKHEITLKIENNEIVKVHYDETHRNGSSKRTDKIYGENMKMAGTTPDSAYSNMEKQLLNKQHLQNIDAVSGATYSKFRFTYAGYLALIKAAIKQREDSSN